jgi:ABC-type bacteriocin/lantibiotic exporters, contain an N-terminal double-glycine peptidase domain
MKKPVEHPVGCSFLNRPVLTGAIEFRDVTFCYPEQEKAALSGVSFRIAPGEKVALVGRVGSGKTTVGKLLLGLFQPKEGAILVDGIDIRQLDPAQLRRRIGTVPQDVVLFFGSLRENILLGNPPVTDYEILEAARTGGVDSFANLHPKGFDLQVGERGERLSSGQRQAVAIARAVLKNPPVLLLDEPTASMDHTSEERVRQNLASFSAGKTVLLVTHRTALLDIVDRLIVLDGGKVVADGPKESVLKALQQGLAREAS